MIYHESVLSIARSSPRATLGYSHFVFFLLRGQKKSDNTPPQAKEVMTIMPDLRRRQTVQESLLVEIGVFACRYGFPRILNLVLSS
jgi:hypothetical protein